MSLEQTFAFLDAGVSRFHSCACAVEQLEAHGFTRLNESSCWDALTPGQGYYLTRNGSAVVAFVMPAAPTGFRMVLSHGDSPTFAVKAAFPAANGVTRLEVEPYGGMLMPTWLDRPLTLAGRAMVWEGDTLTARNVCFDRDLLIIPSLCVHFDRDAHTGRKLNPQVDLQPILGGLDAPTLAALTAETLGVEQERIAALELTLATRQKATRIGAKGEFFAAPRIDDLECAATSLQGFLAAAVPEGIVPLWAMLDNEEVGSSTRQGACGSFVGDVCAAIAESAGITGQKYTALLANSMALSADNGHAVHPNHPEKSDPLNSPVMNSGIILKVNASKKYTTDCIMEGVLTAVLKEAKVPYQTFANRGDVPGGSTLGNLLQHSMSIPMADIGAPQLAMHSAVETAGCADAEYLAAACEAFYAARVTCIGDGQYRFG